MNKLKQALFRLLVTHGLMAGCQTVVAAAPSVNFDLPKLDGTAFVRLEDYAGRPVLMNFWGSECPPCVAEMPLLFAQAQRYPDIQFLGIAVDQRATATRFLVRMQPTYPQLIAANQPEVLMRRFGNRVGALPYTVMVNREHEICASHLGEVDEKWISAAMKTCGEGVSISSKGTH
jgi:thiol-disulfide isomerase/thioredoxin